MTSAALRTLAGLDALYEAVVTSPEEWPDDALAAWAEEAVASGPAPSREVTRPLRRALRVAQRLRDFWIAPPPGVPSDAGDWRTRVDLALGIRAWRPLLEIAQAGLDEAPTEELFEETKRRFREVHGSPWMEGSSFADWTASAS